MKLEELTERIDKLHALLHNPMPESTVWCCFLGKGMGELCVGWQGNTHATAPQPAPALSPAARAADAAMSAVYGALQETP